ncbi:MAG TPA: DUF2231 domain-containing protein [Xanthobacteraceae bacterium]|jgi:uncharacterized membrane protein|nr:DUF2231 domain-containing protein [Xanthobacteraceae bacterium]
MHLIPQSWPHLHILVSVFPSVGLIFVLGFYMAALATKNEVIKRSCLILFGILALLAIPTYLSGVRSMDLFSQDPKVTQSVLNAHYYWGLGALAILVITGGYAVVELWRVGKPSDQALSILLGLAGLTLALMIVVDELGWEINHHELQRVYTPAEAATATPQAWSHVHMILNHFPTVGWVMALTFYVIALVANNDGLKRASLAVFVVLAIVGVPTYVTGAAAMWALTVPPMPGISKAVINAHRDMALWTLFGLGFTGVAAWIEIWRYRYISRFSNTSLYLVLAFAIITLGIMAETGHRGGQINHPEIRVATDVLPTDPTAGISPALELLINNVIWFVPWQTVHFFGFTMIFATVMFVVLRILGFWKAVPFAAVHRLLPIGVIAVVMNVFTGMLMMLADTYRYVVNDYTFAPKIAFIPIGATAVLYFSMSDRLWKLKGGEDAPLFAKAVAILVFVCWAGVIACGRLLPYL